MPASTGAASASSRSQTSAISTGRKCAAVSAGAGRPCRSSRQAHQPNVLRDNPCAAQYSPRLWPLAMPQRDPASTSRPAPLPAPLPPPLFAPVRTEITQPSAREATWGRDVAYPEGDDARIEIALPDGVRVRVGRDVDGAALRRVLAALGR